MQGSFPNSSVGKVTPYPAGDRAGQTMTVDFVLNGSKFVALNGGPEFTFNESISFMVPCEDQAEVDRYWTALTEGGGEESMCGWLKDRFGVSWQVVPTRLEELLVESRSRAGRASHPGAVPDEEDRDCRPGGCRGALAASKRLARRIIRRALRETAGKSQPASRRRAICQHLPEGVEMDQRRFRTDQRDVDRDPPATAWDRRVSACRTRAPRRQVRLRCGLPQGDSARPPGLRYAWTGWSWSSGDRRVPAAGSFGDLADQLGVEFGAPAICIGTAVARSRMTLLILIRRLRGSSSTGTRSAMLHCGCSILTSSRSCGPSTSTWRSCWTIAPTGHHQETTSIRLRTRTSAHMIMMAAPSGTRHSVRYGMPQKFASIPIWWPSGARVERCCARVNRRADAGLQ